MPTWNEPQVRRPRVGDLVTRIRLRLADMQGTKFSDYELTMALNDALGMLWIALAENFSTLPRRTAVLMMEGGIAPLPEDFYSLVEVTDGHVRGSYIESDKGQATLVYNALPSTVDRLDDSVDLPLTLVLDVVEVAAAIAKGESGNAAGIALMGAKRLSQKREVAAIPDTRHFS